MGDRWHETVIKRPFLYANMMSRSGWHDSYSFVHIAVVKRIFRQIGMHAAVAKGKFCVSMCNPLVEIVVSIAQNYSEADVLWARECSAHCTECFSCEQDDALMM